MSLYNISLPEDIQALLEGCEVLWLIILLGLFDLLISFPFQFLLELLQLLLCRMGNREFPLISFCFIVLHSITVYADELVHIQELELLGCISINPLLFLYKSIEEELKVLEGILLLLTGEVLVVLGDHHFEIIGLQAVLIYFLDWFVVDDVYPCEGLGVFARIESVSYFGDLAVEAIVRDFGAAVQMFNPLLVIDVLVLF